MHFQYLKKEFFALLFICTTLIQGQTTLVAGDVAIVGINSDGFDEFTFVLLVDITTGTELFFTDNGILANGNFRPNEGIIKYVAPNNLPAGTVLNYTEGAINTGFSIDDGGFVFATSGDQIIVYTGSITSPTFIFAAQTNSSVFQIGSNDSNQSDLPPGLTVGTTAVAVGAGTGAESEFDNSVYNLSITSGSKATLLAAIANNANWNGNNNRITDLPSNGDFTVTGGTPPPTTVVLKGNNINITDRDTTPSTTDGSDFGNTEINIQDTATFTLENNTISNVDITSVTITGANASNFSVATSITFPATVITGTTQDFTVEFTSATTGIKTATIEVATSLNNISFDITATANDPTSITKINQIQGSGNTSPLVGQLVTIEGIVIGDFQDNGNGANGALRGFFVQEEDADSDANPTTSEGIFIFDGSTPATNVAIGDKVRISGTVSEFFGSTQLSLISAITSISSGNSLPTATSITLPVANTITNSDGKLIPDLEFAENMLVNFSQTLTVSELFQLDRFGEIRLIQGDRPEQFTQQNIPSVTGFTTHIQDIASRSIILDDGLSIQNPNLIKFPDGSLNSSDAFRMGDTTTNLTGVVAFSRGSGGSGDENYRIHSTINPVFNSVNTRSVLPNTVGGTLKIAGFNVLNYFTTIDISGVQTANGSDPRGADTTAEFDRQREKLLNALITIDADIFGLVELENDFSPTSSGNAIKDLVEGLNAQLGANTYDWVNPGAQFIGGDAIAVGVIYKPSSVAITSGTTVEILDDSDFAGLGIRALPAVFNGNSTNRSPIAVTFTQLTNNEKITIIVNHFKSKGSPGTAPSGDNDINDGAGNANQTRVNGAIALNAWLHSDPTGSNDTDFLILGDLNAYAKEEPITFLEDEGYTDLARSFIGSSAYSFIFDGQIGTLDYALSSSSLTNQVTGATEWHVNADEADAIDYNLDFGRNASIFNGNSPFRNSDHDPVIIGLNLDTPVLNSEVFESSNAPNYYPIPFKEEIIISYNFSGTTTINLFDINGKKLISEILSKTTKQFKINTTSIPNGAYLLHIKTNSGEQFSKVIVK